MSEWKRWHARAVERLRLDWGNRSAEQIAADLNVGLRGVHRYTRNMVIGKADRLGLTMTQEQRVRLAQRLRLK